MPQLHAPQSTVTRTYIEADRDRGRVAPEPEIAPMKEVAVEPATEYITEQSLKPVLIAMARGVGRGIEGAIGAIGAYAVGIQVSPDGEITLVGIGLAALIGFCFGWGGRTYEGLNQDQVGRGSVRKV